MDDQPAHDDDSPDPVTLDGLRAPRWIDNVQPMRAIELFEKYRRKVVHPRTGLPFEPSRPQTAYTIERLAFETGASLRLALKVFVPICTVFFGLSFLWDFHGLIRTCSVAGIIGFSTNWVAIKMLFWPREPRPIFGQGLIPSQRDQLIEKVADEVLENLINEALILRKIEEMRLVERFSQAGIDKMRVVLEDPEFKADLRSMILTYVAEVSANSDFRNRLIGRTEAAIEEFVGKGFRTWVVRKLKDVWRPQIVEVLNQEIDNLEHTLDGGLDHVDGVLDRLPAALERRQVEIDKVLTAMLIGLVREVDVRAIVLEQLDTVTAEQLERGFREFSDDKLSFITLLGGLLGVLGGTVIVWPWSIALGLGALGCLALVDFAIQPLMASRYWPKKKRD